MIEAKDNFLKVLITPAVEKMQQEQARARCVMHSCTFSASPLAYSENLHAEALRIVFAKLDPDADIAQARGLPVALEKVAQYRDTWWKDGRAPLFYAFSDPPYGTDWSDAQAEQQFKLWLDYVGLDGSAGVQAMDWVGDPDANPGRSGWSTYFDDGKEWWGIWCLTVWNPKKHTLAVIVASATD